MITLRPHQIAAADAVENAWREGIKRPLVNACVSAGKSLMFAELARREVLRGGRTLILAHTRELVEQNASAVERLTDRPCGINAAALGRRDWRGSIISCSIQSVFRHAHHFGPGITNILGDESHLWPHSDSGMYRQFVRSLPSPRIAGASGTIFRLQGGSLIDGENPPFDRVVYEYTILHGLRDGYLVPAHTIEKLDDAIDVSKLRTRSGEFTAESTDKQTLDIARMDNHIAQMVHYGADRRAWIIFEASEKSARAMAERMNEWRIPTGLVLGITPDDERLRTVEAFRRGQLRALVNIATLTTGFNVEHVDMLVMRRATKSKGLYIQMIGRLLRTIGGNIDSSIAAGKANGLFLDFAGNLERHGPIDCILPDRTKARLVPCDTCGALNSGASKTCWRCQQEMMKNCPACLTALPRVVMVCTACGHDMHVGPRSEGQALSARPAEGQLIKAYGSAVPLAGDWQPVLKAWNSPGGGFLDLMDGARIAVTVPEFIDARWVRLKESDGVSIEAVIVPNGKSRNTAIQLVLGSDGTVQTFIVPMPASAISVDKQHETG